MDIFWEQTVLIFKSKDIWMYLAIPFINGFVGWFTNLLAIRMMFYPIDPIGYPPFLGWQGVIPSKSKKMAALALDMIEGRLLSLKEVFSRLDPERVAQELEQPLFIMAEGIIQDTMQEYSPVIWESMPLKVKGRVYEICRQDLPKIVMEMMEEIKNNIEELFDIRKMVSEFLEKNRGFLNTMFQDCGEREFKFVERSGFFFGFLFGMIQMVVWIFFKEWWLLPLGGLIVGYITNYLAIKLIFEPTERIKLGPFIIQGLFLKRQKEVSATYAQLLSSNIFRSENIMESIMRGPRSDQLFEIIQRHIKKAIDRNTGMTRPFILFIIGTQEYISMKNRVCDKIANQYPRTVHHAYSYINEALDIENTMREKMEALSSEDFIGILRPAFQEDEWKLILVGAILGLGAGLFQLFYLFGEQVLH